MQNGVDTMGNEYVGENGLLYCKVCGEKKEKFLDFSRLDGTRLSEIRKVRTRCKCEREAHEAYEKRLKFEAEQNKINELKKLSLMDAKLREVNFSTYKITEDNRKYLELLRSM